MAEPLSPKPQVGGLPATQKPLVAAAPQEKAKAGETYGSRFRLAYAVLGGLLAVAFALLVVALLGGRLPTGPAWSAWKPGDGSRVDKAKEIAAHVAPEYRLAPGGRELVAIQAHTPEVQNIPVAGVVVRGASGSSSDYTVSEAKNMLSFVLCGLGPRCSIEGGTPSQARARLLRREALELALYTFKYVGGVDSVVAFLPPNPNDDSTNWGLFLRKDDFHGELKRPLRETLPPPARGKLVPASVTGNAQQQTIERLTRPYWYTIAFQQLQNGDPVYVLDPLIAAG